jgi:uncharacterized membrane protein YfcA
VPATLGAKYSMPRSLMGYSMPGKTAPPSAFGVPMLKGEPPEKVTLGVVVGYFVLGRIGDQDMRQLIGGIVVTLVAVHLFRRWRARRKPATAGDAEAEHPIWFAPVIGVLAGFTTLVANAAGPLMAVYLLAMRLPKLEYVGTAAVFFLLLNLFKVPFMVSLGLITQPSFALNLWLAPAVLAGALAGRKILPLINQKMFENLALFFSAAAGLRLLF